MNLRSKVAKRFKTGVHSLMQVTQCRRLRREFHMYPGRNVYQRLFVRMNQETQRVHCVGGGPGGSSSIRGFNSLNNFCNRTDEFFDRVFTALCMGLSYRNLFERAGEGSVNPPDASVQLFKNATYVFKSLRCVTV